MLRRKIICILFAIVLIFNTCIVSIATNETNNTENIQGNQEENTQQNNNINTEEIDRLNEQKNELDNKIEDANSKLEYVQGKLSVALLEIQKLSDKIKTHEDENTKLQKQLNDYETSITETTSLLETVTAEYNQKDQLLKERLVTAYELGELSYLDVLLSSSSLSEMLSRYYIMQEMAEYDNQLIEKVAQQKNTIEISKRKLENETAQVRILKSKAEQNEIVLRNTKTLHQEYVDRLSEEEKEINDEIEDYKIEYAKVQYQLQEISQDIGEFEIQYTGGKMIWPVAISGTTITSYYGSRWYPLAETTTGITDFHLGLDIAAPAGSPEVAALDGVVTYAGWLGSYGNCVMIYHGDGITTVYGHGRKILTERGKEVKQGEIIMEVGSTGNSTGPHLHFEVRVNGQTTNPLKFVNKP